MTAAPEAGEPGELAVPKDLVTVTIDGIEISVPKGTLLIRAAEQLGIQIPRFCDHPLLDPAGACRQCLVEVTDMGNGRGMPKPAASCTTTVMPRHGDQDPADLARSPTRRSRASWSCCSSTTRSTARSATRAASARCRTRR